LEPPQNSRTQKVNIKPHTENLQILGAAIQNVVVWGTWYPGFVHPCLRNSLKVENC